LHKAAKTQKKYKSFRRKDGKGNPPGAGGDVDFHGEKRKNQTHESTTDPMVNSLVNTSPPAVATTPPISGFDA
jgi:hypothetical protein